MMEFSLMALILRSEDWITFIPFPLCPITTNLGNLNPPLLISKPEIKSKQSRKWLIGRKTAWMNERMNVTVGETVEEGEGGIFWHEVEGGNVGDVDGFESHFLVRERERGFGWLGWWWWWWSLRVEEKGFGVFIFDCCWVGICIGKIWQRDLRTEYSIYMSYAFGYSWFCILENSIALTLVDMDTTQAS